MLKLYPQAQTPNEIEEYPEGIDAACHDIREACKGFGTDEDKLNDVLGTKTAYERSLISRRYPQLYDGKSLKDLMKSETSGDYGKLLQLLSVPIEESEAIIIRTATKGLGTTEKLLYPVVCGRTNEEIDMLKKAFFHVYDKDLVSILNSDLSGDFGKFIMTSCQELIEKYDPSIHTDAKAEEIAKKFYDAGQGKWGTDEKTFFRLLCSTPVKFMEKVDRTYALHHGNTLEKAIKKEFSGKCEDAMLQYIGMILKPYETIAALFESTMKGLGTDEYGLSCALVRYQSVLPKVKDVYEKKYGKTLRDRIHGETSGHYRNLLLRILNTC